MKRTMRGLNKCHWCKKFRRWDDLHFAYEYGYYYEPKEILECTKCRDA